MTAKTIKPFADDSSVLTLDGLTVENGTLALSIHGDIEITRDRKGLDRARILADLLSAAVSELEAEADLPDNVALDTGDGGSVKNPFS